MRRRRHVAIVGGGFSGVALAAQLLRDDDGTLRATLLESGDRLGRGLAYGTSNPSHLLNTRAERMSLFAEDGAHFVRWCRARGRYVEGTDFVPRSVYGDYLEETLDSLACGAERAAFAALLRTEVVDLEPLRGGFVVVLRGGALLHADEVVLATGHPRPANPLGRWLPDDAPRYIGDPWRSEQLAAIGRNDRVLLLGTGLTMVDVALSLADNGHRGEITALSRRGLLPLPHDGAHAQLPRDVADRLRGELSRGNLRLAVRAVRAASAEVMRRGLHWQAVVDALRASTEPFWAALCAADRRRFVQHLRPYWDVHRHRLPPASAERLAALRDCGRLLVVSGRAQSAEFARRGIAITIRERGRAAPRAARFDWIVNCTGPVFSRRTCRPLERRLQERGLLVADPLALGYLTTPAGLAFGAHGPVEGLHVLGPACRSRRWEHTAVPELREQARALAARLRLETQRLSPSLRQR